MAAEYIEREAAIVAIKNLYPGIPLAKIRLQKWHEENKNFMECELAIERIPAADVVPARHGQWVLKREQITIDSFWVRWECSECGCCRARGWEHTSDGRKPRANFCEMCGALMDKDGDGE